MNYVIKYFIEESGQLIIDADNYVFSVDVPLTNEGLYITGETLDNYIKGFIPVDFITRSKKIAAGVANASELKALATETPPSSPESLARQNLTFEVDQLVKEALTKLGVISE